MSVRRLTAPHVKPSTAPVTAAELRRAARALREDPAARATDPATSGARASTSTGPAPVRREDLRALRGLVTQYGAVHDVDVAAVAAKMGEAAGANLAALYAAVKKLKAQGALTSPWRAQTVTDTAVQQLSRATLSPRVTRHVQKLARLELLKLFADPVKDAALHEVLLGDLKKSFRVPERALREHEVPPDIPLRERNARAQNALLALLFDPGLPAELKRAAVDKLAVCGNKDALPTLASLAKAEPALAGAVKTTTKAIEKAGKMTLVFCSMEVAPYAFAGGLGNVMDELPQALARLGHRVIVVSPRHAIIDRSTLEDSGKRIRVSHPTGDEPAQLLRDDKDGVEHWFVENGKFYSDGRYGLYGDEHGPYGDVAERYDFFSMAIPEALKAILGDERPDIVQLNDAHTAPAAAYLKRDDAFADTKTVMAVHNLGGAYQGKFGAEVLPRLGFKDFGLSYPTGPAEFYGGTNFLKLGLATADAAVTVSRQYMREILDKEHGEGLEGVLRLLYAEERLWGNLNGIDTKSWDPSTDPALPAPYSFADQAGKAACKSALQARYGLPQRADTPLVGAVSRITDQKGIDDIVATVERRMTAGEDVQFVVCGTGDAALCAQLADLAKRYPDNVAFDGAFAKDKERKIIAGADLFLMPSRFEPCGLPQMYAMRYLTVPVVRAVGGLEESVQPYDALEQTGTGFKFGGARGGGVDDGLDAALAWYRQGDGARAALIRNCALADFSWETTSAAEQVAFFRTLT